LINTPAKKKLIRITTVPLALHSLLPGQMRFMQQNNFDVLMISSDGAELEGVLQKEGCRHIIVSMTRKITPLQDLKCLITLIKIFKKEKPHIVHTHTPKAGLLGMMAAKFCGVKLRIHTVAGLPLMVEKGIKYRLLKFTEKLTYTAANHVWPNSNSLLQFIQQKKFANIKKLKVIGKGSSNGINLNRYNPASLNEKIILQVKQNISYAEENKYLLCVGRLVKDKGIVELVNVFTALQKNNPLLKLILVGSYEEKLDPLPKAVLQQIFSNNGIIQIKWTDKVEYYMHIADYFVFPSLREGFPNVLLQAGAMRLPIICSRITGNIDIVENSNTGLIFNTSDEMQMQQQILFALNNPQAMQVMAVRLASIIDKNFEQQNFWNEILKNYNNLLGEG
jgi:glycosyltransferase involved in cell wall biosynthesis